MRVLMTTDTVGGVWSYCIELIREMQSLDIEVCLAAKGEPSRAQRQQLAGLDHVILESRQFALEWMPDPWDDIASAGEWLLELQAIYQPSVVHLNDYAHGCLSWNAPVLIVGHSCVCSWLATVRQQGVGPEWKRYQQAVQAGLHAADTVIAPSKWMLAQLERFYGTLARSAVIYNGCNPYDFRVCHPKSSKVFAAGRWWDPAKNLGLLQEVAPTIEWPLAIAGGDRLDEENIVQDAPTQCTTPKATSQLIQHLGRLPHPAMIEEYASSAIFAHPALYEPFGLTVLEAALSGCALVVSDLASLREIWQGAAVYVDPHDVSQWSHSINRLIHEPQRREEMARRAYQRGVQLSSQAMANSYANAYEQCVKTGRLVHDGLGSQP